jgi:sigma-B regulation protein RsbU (phosphoserine phosphatase)
MRRNCGARPRDRFHCGSLLGVTMFENATPLTVILLLVANALALGAVAWLVRVLRRLRRERNELLQQKDVVFNFVYDVSEVFAESETVELTGLLNRVLSYAVRTARASAGALYMVNADGVTLTAEAVAGVFPPIVGGLDATYENALSKVKHVEGLVRAQKARTGSGLVGEAFFRGGAVLIADAEIDSQVPSFGPDFLHIHSLLLIPLRFRHEVLGVLAVINRIDGMPFNMSDADLLQALIDQAAVTVHYAQISVALDEKRRLDYDLGVAREIQAALLPEKLPEIAGLHMTTFSVPARQIGGDYYDVIPIDDDHLGLVVGDVSGKSISGAIVMAMCRSLLHVTARECLSPAETLRRLNTMLGHDMGEDLFVSMAYAVLNVRSRHVVLARAGHVEPLLFSASENKVRMIKSDGIALGLTSPEIFDPALQEVHVDLDSGDMLVFYTDGVTEAQSADGQEWGLSNLVQTVEDVGREVGGTKRLAGDIQERLLAFVGEMDQYDDMTLLAFRMDCADGTRNRGAE